MWFRKNRTVQAKRFELRDDEGNLRAALGFGKEGDTRLDLVDRDGRPRVSLRLSRDNVANLSLALGEKRGAIEIEANERLDSAGLIVRGDKGGVQILLGLTSNGIPALALFTQDGRLVFPQRPLQESAPGEAGHWEFDWDRLLRDF